MLQFLQLSFIIVFKERCHRLLLSMFTKIARTQIVFAILIKFRGGLCVPFQDFFNCSVRVADFFEQSLQFLHRVKIQSRHHTQYERVEKPI